MNLSELSMLSDLYYGRVGGLATVKEMNRLELHLSSDPHDAWVDGMGTVKEMNRLELQIFALYSIPL